MAKIEPPGNPEGWGDPGPIVLVILLLIFLGTWVGGFNRPLSVEQCREFLERLQ